jgi:hypothetical protein
MEGQREGSSASVVSRRGTANSGRAKASRVGGQSHEVPRPVRPVREEGSGGFGRRVLMHQSSDRE